MRWIAMVAAACAVTPVSAQWTISTSSDRMTGELWAIASSPPTQAAERMAFPYQGTTARIAFACDSDSEWAYISFTQAPNLADTENHDGYVTFDARVRWGDAVETTRFRQNWGGDALHFWPYAPSIAKLLTANSLLVELDWYGNGQTYFRFSLIDSSEAIAEARSKC